MLEFKRTKGQCLLLKLNCQDIILLINNNFLFYYEKECDAQKINLFY